MWEAATYPDTRVILLLVGLVRALGVADLRVEVLDVLGHVVADTAEVGPLEIGVEVDLDDAVRDGLLELRRRGAGAAVEHEERGLVVLGLELLLEVGLVLAEAERGVSKDHFPASRMARGAKLTARGGA